MSIMCFLFQNQYARLQKTAKRSEINWNQANIESTLKMCREGKSIRASEKACGMSEATLQNRFKMQEEGIHLWGLEKESRLKNKKENN